MVTRLHHILLPSAVLLSGCYDDGPYQDYVASVSAPEVSTGSTTGGSTATASVTITEPTAFGSNTDTDTGAGTSGSGSDSDTGSTAGSDSDSDSDSEDFPKPTQISLEVSPPVLKVAGLLEISVEHTNDVDRIKLFQSLEEDPVLEWHAADPPPALLVTRGEFGEQRSFRALGYDAEDNHATSNEVFVELQLPKPGTLLWEENFDVGADGEGRAVAAGMIAGDPKLLVGFHDDYSAIVGRYTGEGSPQTLVAPSSAPLSIATGVALDAHEKIIAVGVELIDEQERAWVVRVDPHTAVVQKLFAGKPGEAATGVALDPVTKRIYVSGYEPGEVPSNPDATLWALAEDGTLLWKRTWERPLPEMEEGDASDRALAVAVLDNGDPVIVGESSWKDPMKPEDPAQRWAFVHRYNPNGTLDEQKSWVSAGVVSWGGASSVAPDRDNGLLVGGWSRVSEELPLQATVFAFGPLLKEAELYMSEAVGDWNVKASRRLVTGDFVYAADFDDDELGRHDVEVRGVEGLFGPPAWSHVFEAADVARVGGLTVTRDGHIVVIGTRRSGGVNSMFLAALHP